MNCFPCFSSQKSKKEGSSKGDNGSPFDDPMQSRTPENMEPSSNQAEPGNIDAQTFYFRELAVATKNFRQECLLGEGGFGRVYKGTLQSTGQVVAIKQLDRNAMQGNNEFLVEVGKLSHLKHANLVNLVGYCGDGDQRHLVFEYMSEGSVENHLLDIKGRGNKPLDWITRMKIAYGAAQALEYLHEKANPPVIYRDLKSSNVLLDEEFNAKLSDVGLDKLGPSADSKMPMQSRVLGTYGYSAPEYSRSGKLTTIADVYSFGVVLLELITGRRAIDTTKPADEQNLVAWAQPIFREPKQFPEMADPLLKKRFPERGLNQAVAIAAMCLQDEAAARPLMSDIVTALSFLSVATEENNIPPALPAAISSKLHCISTKLQWECGDKMSTLNESNESSDNESVASSTRSSSANNTLDEVIIKEERKISESSSSSKDLDDQHQKSRETKSVDDRKTPKKGRKKKSSAESNKSGGGDDDGNNVYLSRKNSKKSSKDDGSNISPRQRTKKPPDGSTSLSRKSSKKSSQQGNYNSSNKASADESNSSGSGKKARRKAKKAAVNGSSPSHSSSNGGSMD